MYNLAVLMSLIEYSLFDFDPLYSVRKQVVNIPSFIVRLDSQKHIDFSTRSPLGGGRPGRVKRRNMRRAQSGGGGEEEEDED